MSKSKYSYKLVPISHIHQDNDQPRKDIDDKNARAKLRASIDIYGIAIPLAVCQFGDDEYKIIDGHRRYLCAADLGMEEAPCLVYSKMPEGEFESRRYEMQNNKKSWMPIEKSNALARIKDLMGFKTNRELADYLHMSETPVANSLQLRNQSLNYLELMNKYGLSQSYQTEFVRLKPKIRKVKSIEPNEVIILIFKKVQHQVIKTSRDFRKLGRVFLRATANEKGLFEFLDDPDMTVEELSTRTVQSGFTKLIEDLMLEIKTKLDEGEKFTEQEEPLLKQLSILLSKAV
ncbi:MAG: ParB N-terminal domain-containing protein [Minisyncoccia bacterium]